MNNIKNLRKPLTLEEKYKVAVNALQAISQRNTGKNEWDAATACYDIQAVATETLKRLDEDIVMSNRNKV